MCHECGSGRSVRRIMMRAVKGNKEYIIDESQQKSYQDGWL
ncbi:MAG: hypothetical protein ACLTBV_18670 [Enterocloster bolteae]